MVETWCVSYKEGMWLIHGVLVTWCVSYREGLCWIHGVLVTRRECRFMAC